MKSRHSKTEDGAPKRDAVVSVPQQWKPMVGPNLKNPGLVSLIE